MDGGAWWAAVYGVAQSQTRLKQLSSSSSIVLKYMGKYQHSGLSPELFPQEQEKEFQVWK